MRNKNTHTHSCSFSLQHGIGGFHGVVRAPQSICERRKRRGPYAPSSAEGTATSVKLVKAPTKENLAAYLRSTCAHSTSAPVALPRVRSDLASRGISICFRNRAAITNVAPIQIPVAELLAAFKAYPQATSGQNLGAVCVSFCASGRARKNDPNACKQSGRDIRTLNDFAGATANFLSPS